MALKVGTCKLCLEEKPLLRRTHIIPNFMFNDLFDEHHQLIKVPTHELVSGILKNPARPSTGEYEGDILCMRCDNEVIGQYETYAKQALYNKTPTIETDTGCKNFLDPSGIKYTLCEKIDYNRLKLFILSIVWRAGISSRPMFAEIQLGLHQERMRSMIFNGDSGQPDEFPILLFTWANSKVIGKELISQPIHAKIGNETRYTFLIDGIQYNAFTSIDAIQSPFHEHILQPRKCMIFHIPEGREIEFLHKHF